jgi:hypothetical protein
MDPGVQHTEHGFFSEDILIQIRLFRGRTNPPTLLSCRFRRNLPTQRHRKKPRLAIATTLSSLNLSHVCLSELEEGWRPQAKQNNAGNPAHDTYSLLERSLLICRKGYAVAELLPFFMVTL